jgi:hypothetical protein
VERIFALFDGNGDGHITFPEFIKGIALLSPNGTQKEKTKCACPAPMSSCCCVCARMTVCPTCARMGLCVLIT